MIRVLGRGVLCFLLRRVQCLGARINIGILWGICDGVVLCEGVLDVLLLLLSYGSVYLNSNGTDFRTANTMLKIACSHFGQVVPFVHVFVISPRNYLPEHKL